MKSVIFLPGSTARWSHLLPRLVLRWCGLFEIANDIREFEHRVARQHIGKHVCDRYVGDRTADAVVFVEQVKNHQFEFGFVVFGKSKTSFDVPKPEILVETFRKSCVKAMIDIVA